jgi:hypothetical protein
LDSEPSISFDTSNLNHPFQYKEKQISPLDHRTASSSNSLSGFSFPCSLVDLLGHRRKPEKKKKKEKRKQKKEKESLTLPLFVCYDFVVKQNMQLCFTFLLV